MSHLGNYFSKNITFDETMANFKRLVTIGSQHTENYTYEQSLDESIIMPEFYLDSNFIGLTSVVNSSRGRSYLNLDKFYNAGSEIIFSARGKFWGGAQDPTKQQTPNCDLQNFSKLTKEAPYMGLCEKRSTGLDQQSHRSDSR